MNKNWIGGIRCWASGPLIAKPISIKGTGCKFGGCALKAVELTSGDLPLVRDTGLRIERLVLTGRQEVSSGRSSLATDEGPNGSPQGG